jgi:multimeric flavodoxin WrbA
MKNILIINGSLGGALGNTSVLIQEAEKLIAVQGGNTDVLHLEDSEFSDGDVFKKLTWANGFIFTTGTYWDSWGSPMQKFLESCTQYEASNIFLFKPAAVMVSMHSVGGKSVLSRLQGVLNTMGIAIPPMSGLVYALSTHLAMQSENTSFNEDFWSMEDVEIIVHNLMTAVNKKYEYKAWPVDRKDPKRRWLHE